MKKTIKKVFVVFICSTMLLLGSNDITTISVNAKSKTVYTTATGECYHSKSKCGRTKYSKKTTEKKAKAQGYRKCKRCFR